MSDGIPKEFRQCKCKARTVGDLKEHLDKLPDDLLLYSRTSDCVRVIVTRVNGDYSALMIEEDGE